MSATDLERGPVREYRSVIDDSGNLNYVNRLLVGTAVTGLVRVEWVMARYGQVIPCNWSQIQVLEWMDGYMPLRYQVADAQNLIVQRAIDLDMEWLFLLEHDVILPPDAFIRLNEYMLAAEVPVVSGLYFTRSRPSEPVVYRGRGVGRFNDVKVGEPLWVDGVPTGCLLVHMSLMREMWKDSPEYNLKGRITRRVFETPARIWTDPQTGDSNVITGTSDLAWCERVIKGSYLEKAGWKRFADQEYPFLVDTNIFCKHINPNGEQFP